MSTTVNELMTHDPQTVTPLTTVQEAARIMLHENVGSIPIVEAHRCVGTITDRDIATRVVAHALSLETPVGDVSSKQVVTVAPQQPVAEATRLMAEHQVRRLPVCEEDGRIVGIVAQADIARHESGELTGETVEQISR